VTAHAPVSPWKKRSYVYKWSNASGFRGVLSSFDDLKLYGWGHPFISKDEWDATKQEFIPIPLVLVRSQKDWYKEIVGDACVQTLSFLCPVSRYSPITNLCMLGQKGVTYSRMMTSADEGVLIPNQAEVTNRPGMIKRTAIASWGKPQAPPQMGLSPSSSSSSSSSSASSLTTAQINAQFANTQNTRSVVSSQPTIQPQQFVPIAPPRLANQLLQQAPPQIAAPNAPMSVEQMENDPTLGEPVGDHNQMYEVEMKDL